LSFAGWQTAPQRQLLEPQSLWPSKTDIERAIGDWLFCPAPSSCPIGHGSYAPNRAEPNFRFYERRQVHVRLRADNAECARDYRLNNLPALPALDFLHDQICQITQAREIGCFQETRAGVEDTQGPNAGSVIEKERMAGIESDSGLIDNQRIAGKSCVEECVRHNHRLTIINHVSTKCGITRCLFRIKTVARFEPLTVVVDQADKCDGHIEERGRETCDPIKSLFGLGARIPSARSDVNRRSSSAGMLPLIHRHAVRSTHVRILV
jgi:hypothetical protein